MVLFFFFLFFFFFFFFFLILYKFYCYITMFKLDISYDRKMVHFQRKQCFQNCFIPFRKGSVLKEKKISSQGVKIRYSNFITKTCLYNFDPWNPTFIYDNRGLQGYTLLFLFLFKNIDCWYSLEPLCRGGSNEYPQSIFWAEIRKIMYTSVNPSFSI